MTVISQVNLSFIERALLRGEKMALEALFPVLWWSGPVGLDIFFAGLGYLIKCAATAA